MNSCNIAFLNRNNIDPEEISSRVDCSIHTTSEINPIVYECGIQEDKIERSVSIANIVGIHFGERRRRNIFGSMDDYFDSNGDGYHIRSVGMLVYNKENIIEGLKKSFRVEPVVVTETGEESYTIFLNGLHRFTILRILYLKELSDANGDEKKINEIKEKFKIPVQVAKINLEKTYCKYILKQIDRYNQEKPEICSIDNEFDENYRKTGNVKIEYYSGKIEIISQEELKKRTKDRLTQITQNGDIPFYITNNLRYTSFMRFMVENMPDIYNSIKELRRSN